MKTDDRILFLMSRAQHAVAEHLKKKFLDDNVSISPAQMGILFLLQKGNLRPMSELGRLLDIDNSTITGLVDRLEKTGFVERSADPNDRRKWLISITETGDHEINQAKKSVKEVNRQVKEGFTEEEVETFKKVLSSFLIKFRDPGRES